MRHIGRATRQRVRWWPLVVLSIIPAATCGGNTIAPTTTGSHTGTTSLPLSQLQTIAEWSTVEQVGAGQTSTSNNYLGQSVTIPGTSSVNNLRFNWTGSVSTAPLTQSTAGPLAVGDLFILTREYLGLPEDLGVSTPRFLAQSERIEDGRYVFAPSVTLAGRTKYWFYSRWAPGSAGTVSPITGFSEDTYAGGDMYIAPSSEAESRRFPSEKHRRAGV